jgi:hypothetical protein
VIRAGANDIADHHSSGDAGGDIAAILGTPTEQQIIKNKRETAHHFQ